MPTSFDIAGIAEALTTTRASGAGSADLFRVLLCELAMGHPVSRETLAAAGLLRARIRDKRQALARCERALAASMTGA